jgi:hypothetical protein
MFGAPNFFLASGPSGPVDISYTYSTNTANASLNITSISGYVAGLSNVTITVNSGIYIYGTGSSAGLTLTGGTTGDTVTLVNKGFILGQGGQGSGYYSTSANPGYNALSLGFNTTVNNTDASAYIAGGGGGGGAKYDAAQSSYDSGGGGAGGGDGGQSTIGIYENCCLSLGSTPGTGGSPGNAGSASGPSGAVPGGYVYVRSAGGGGRILPGTGAAQFLGGGSGGGGADGKAGGTGGTGGSGSSAGSAGNKAGGGGGGWGASGGAGVNSFFSSGGTAGSGGKAVALNGKTITWVSGDTTRVYGSVS